MEKLGSLEPAHPLPDAGPVAGPVARPVAGVPVDKVAGPVGDEGATMASSKLFWCACVKLWLPPAYREELYHVLRLTGPLVSRGVLVKGAVCYSAL